MKTITKLEFECFVNRLIEESGKEIVGVRSKGKKYVFGILENARQLTLDYDVTILSPKKYFFPQYETLASYDNSKELILKPVNEVQERIIIGIHPYDISALLQMDQVFEDGDADSNYLRKRDASIIIGVNMVKVSPYAFASSMGTATVESGYDIMITDIGDQYYLEIGTSKGQELIDKYGKTTDASTDESARAEKAKENVLLRFERRLNFPVEELPKLLRKTQNSEVTFSQELSYSLPKLRTMLKESIKFEMFWDSNSEKCLSCGSCVMVCPTCYCFDVHDMPDFSLKVGEKQRTWDGCMLQSFAKVATGENFRGNKSSRYSHRFMRKGLYLHDRYGEIACVGCGRCSSACLPDIADPTKLLNHLKEVVQ